MRLLAVIVLTSLMMLAALPERSAAGRAMHDCAACPEGMFSTERQAPDHHQDADASCDDMATCASHALLDNTQPLRDDDLLQLRHAWPEPQNGTTISLSLDLPPPRA